MDSVACRESAKKLYDEAFELLNKSQRTEDENFRLIHSAHSSICFWAIVGTPLHVVRGERFLSRVYTTLGMHESAIVHAKRSVTLCEENVLSSAETALSWDAAARAAYSGGSFDEYLEYNKKAELIYTGLENSDGYEVLLRRVNDGDDIISIRM